MFFFFFSSRRRHTRCYRDWSSDVCSSDLEIVRAHRQRLLLETGVACGCGAALRLELGERDHAVATTCHRLERDHVPQRRQARPHLADLLHLRGGRAEHRDRPRVPEDVLDLVRRQGGVNRHVGDAGAEARVVGQRPLEPRLREDRHTVAGRDAQLPQPERDGAHAGLRLAVRDRRPGAGHFVAEGGRPARVALDGIEEHLDQRMGAHGWNLTTKVTESGTGVPTARRALAVTTTLSGTGPAMSRSLTLATPEAAVVTVSVVTSACAVSLVTSVTGPAVAGSVIA